MENCFFLKVDQAIDAVCDDFRRYDPQILLFCEIVRLISGGEVIIERDKAQNGVWINPGGSRNMRWMDETQLIDYLCDLLKKSDLSVDILAAVCSRVFQTRAAPSSEPGTGIPGIRIETGMQDFQCVQCGRCCHELDYQDELSADDVERWRQSGRTDILEWVGVFKRNENEEGYRIWVIPGKRELADKCPFLIPAPAHDRWVCQIHDVKPNICRQYPVTRKHAQMTGCQGFTKQS